MNTTEATRLHLRTQFLVRFVVYNSLAWYTHTAHFTLEKVLKVGVVSVLTYYGALLVSACV